MMIDSSHYKKVLGLGLAVVTWTSTGNCQSGDIGLYNISLCRRGLAQTFQVFKMLFVDVCGRPRMYLGMVSGRSRGSYSEVPGHTW